MSEAELETLRSAAGQMPGRDGELLRMALGHAERLQAERDALRRQLEQAGQRGDAVAWQVRNGLVTHGFYRTEKEASEVRLDMQKAHDLGGSLSAFNLRPLYAAPVPPAPAEAAQPTDTVPVPRNDLEKYLRAFELTANDTLVGRNAASNLRRLLAGGVQ